MCMGKVKKNIIVDAEWEEAQGRQKIFELVQAGKEKSWKIGIRYFLW